MGTTQVAVRLDDQTIHDLDWLVARCSFDSRGEGIRAALAELVRQERSRQIDEQLVEAYRERPQTDEELAWLRSGSTFASLPDEDWS